MFIPIIGNHSLLNETKDSEFKLIYLGSGKDLIIKSTMFPHINVRKGIWKSPDDRDTLIK